MSIFKTKKILHPFLLFALFLITLANERINYGIVINWSDLILGLLTFLLTFIMIYLFCRIIKFDYIKTSLFLTLNIFFLLFFRQITDVIKNINGISSLLYFVDYKEVITLFFYFASILVLFIIFKIQKEKEYILINSYLNILILLLILYNGFNVIKYKESEIKIENPIDFKQSMFKSNNYPDIYYFILDGYTSNISFKEYYNFDNSFFENKLRKKGFFIASKSKCNYNITLCSFPSFTNSSYLNITNNYSISNSDSQQLSNLINHNQLLNYLKKMNYDIFSYNSITYDDKRTIFNIDDKLSNFSLFKNTLYFQCLKFIFNNSNYSMVNQKKRYDYSLSFFPYVDSISNLKSDRPKFLMAYSYAPHGSFSFAMDKKGNFKKLSEIPNIKTRYLNQVEYLNNRLLSLIDSIKQRNSRDFIIIMHADHGSHNFDIKESLTILNTFYFSDQDYSLLYDSISPVNNFRVVLKKLYNPDIELLKDSSYSVSYGK